MSSGQGFVGFGAAAGATTAASTTGASGDGAAAVTGGGGAGVGLSAGDEAHATTTRDATKKKVPLGTMAARTSICVRSSGFANFWMWITRAYYDSFVDRRVTLSWTGKERAKPLVRAVPQK